jgi:hypothetical protein
MLVAAAAVVGGEGAMRRVRREVVRVEMERRMVGEVGVLFYWASSDESERDGKLKAIRGWNGEKGHVRFMC